MGDHFQVEHTGNPGLQNRFHRDREESFRVRIVFAAPADRVHIFYSVVKDTQAEVEQIVEDLRPVLVHAVSVQIQRFSSVTGWSILPTNEWLREPRS
jgi:hypothetical protein